MEEKVTNGRENKLYIYIHKYLHIHVYISKYICICTQSHSPSFSDINIHYVLALRCKIAKQYSE